MYIYNYVVSVIKILLIILFYLKSFQECVIYMGK